MPVDSNGVWLCPDAAFGGAYGTMPKPINGMRDAWRASDIDAVVNTPFHQLTLAQGIAMDFEKTAIETTGDAEKALASLKQAVDKFRSTIANDLTSIKAASSRVSTETLKMREAYAQAVHLLTSQEFETAIANAERMATALVAIRDLSETKLSLAIFSGHKEKSHVPNPR